MMLCVFELGVVDFFIKFNSDLVNIFVEGV